MTRVLVPLAPGFEELEAVSITNILRRAGIEVLTAGLEPGPVRASRGTVVIPDVPLEQVMHDDFDMVVLPGGLPGADNLRDDPRVLHILRRTHASGRWVGAICAAPKVLAVAGLLAGRRATHYPGALSAEELAGVKDSDAAIELDDRVITSRGPGTAMDFALALVELLVGRAKRDEVEQGLVRR
ncbi:MAG: DJ-1/PfpI family protein [Halothiobacillaceae bacterium]|nr:MAG: DJ-1/PfpI family protein [Halothiobacillaceae bacterium]